MSAVFRQHGRGARSHPPAHDASKDFEDLRREALGAFHNGGARVNKTEVRNTQLEGANRGVKAAAVISHTIIEAVRRGACFQGNTTEIIGLGFEEKLEEAAEGAEENGGVERGEKGAEGREGF